MTTELLEKRLESLAADAPDAGRVSAHVLSASPGRVRPVWPRVGLSLVGVIVLVALVAYFVPAADTAVASKAPWGGDILQWAGLVGARDRITYVDSEASSSGYSIRLEGVYADSTRTVLLLHAEPVAVFPFRASLTDQFGRSYEPNGGVADTRTGDSSVEFEPLAWPDQYTGARITLRVSQLQTVPGAFVNGLWAVTATIGVDVAKPLPAPADGQLGPAHFHFTSASYTPATIQVDFEVTGVSPEDLGRIVPDGGKGGPALIVLVLDPSGQVINGNSAASGAPYSYHALGFRTGGGGDYVLRVSYYGYGSFDRVIRIP